MTDIATAAYSYDGANRMTNLAYTGNGGQISIDSFAFTLDNADRITARTSSVDGTVSYGYDTTNQVTGATYTGGSGEPANESYTYSKNGNRTNTGYSTGTNNQLLSDGTFNYAYDGEGNRTVRTRISNASANDYKTTYTWDYRNRLTDVEYFNNSGVLTKHVHYIYDSLDHEIGKQVDDTGGGSYDRAEWYVLDVSPVAPAANVPSTSLADPLLEFAQNGNLEYRYLNGPTPAGVDAVMGEEAISTQGQAGTQYWSLGDQVNTPHEVVNNASTTVDHIITNTFGAVTSESNTSIHHWAGFEGGHFDPDSALVNDDHRWYDPVVGRWLSEDPTGFAAGDNNLDRYADNNPVSETDSSGLIGGAPWWAPPPPGPPKPGYHWVWVNDPPKMVGPTVTFKPRQVFVRTGTKTVYQGFLFKRATPVPVGHFETRMQKVFHYKLKQTGHYEEVKDYVEPKFTIEPFGDAAADWKKIEAGPEKGVGGQVGVGPPF